MYMERNMQISSDLATNQISLTKSPPKPAQWCTERCSQTEPAGFTFLSTVNKWG